MPRTPQDVTEAELSVLQRIWDRGAMTVRQLTDELYPGGGASEYATVQKLLERLRIKKQVERNRNVWPHVFKAAIERDELIGRRLQSTADQLCNGSLHPLITTLVKSSKLSAKDRTSLRVLLDDLDKEAKRKNG